MKTILLLLVSLLSFFNSASAQLRDTFPAALPEKMTEIHAVNPFVSIPLIAGGAYMVSRKIDEFNNKPGISLTELASLNPDDVPGIDQISLRQDYRKRSDAIFASDYLYNAGQAAPIFLFISKKYRKKWLDIGLMYFEAQAMQGMIYGYSPFGPSYNDRLRPFAYYGEIEAENRQSGIIRNSRFSGHVSSTTTGFFFTAKMIDDFNPDLTGGQRILLYSAAAIPSIYSGWLRIRALKHFPTDTMLGFANGIFSGIMVPQFHKWWAKRHRSRAMINPIVGNGVAGAGFNLVF